MGESVEWGGKGCGPETVTKGKPRVLKPMGGVRGVPLVHRHPQKNGNFFYLGIISIIAWTNAH